MGFIVINFYKNSIYVSIILNTLFVYCMLMPGQSTAAKIYSYCVVFSTSIDIIDPIDMLRTSMHHFRAARLQEKKFGGFFSGSSQHLLAN